MILIKIMEIGEENLYLLLGSLEDTTNSNSQIDQVVIIISTQLFSLSINGNLSQLLLIIGKANTDA